jgi:hypothetical protein
MVGGGTTRVGCGAAVGCGGTRVATLVGCCGALVAAGASVGSAVTVGGVTVGCSTVSVSDAKRPAVRVCAYTSHTPGTTAAGSVAVNSNRPCTLAVAMASMAVPTFGEATVGTRPIVTSSPGCQSAPITASVPPDVT